MQRKIKIKILIIQLLTILPFLLFIFYLVDNWYDTRRTIVLEENVNYAKFLGEDINHAILSGQTSAQIISQPSIFDTVTKNKENANPILKDILSKIPQLDNIHIADTNGNTIATTLDIPKEQETSFTIRDRQYFQEVIRTKETVVSPLLFGLATNNKIVVSASPVLKNGELTAVISIGIDVEKLNKNISDLLAKNIYQGKHTVILLDSNGKIVFMSGQSDLSDEETDLLADSEYFKQAKQGKTYYIDNINLPIVNKKMIGASLSINSSGWVLISVVPTEEIFAPILKLQSVIWLILFSALLFSVSVSTYLIRKIRIIF